EARGVIRNQRASRVFLSCGTGSGRRFCLPHFGKHLAISVMSVCTTVLLLEIGIRIASPQDLGFWDSDSFRRLQTTAPHFVENIPHGKANFIGVPVAINSLGLRGDEISVPKPPRTVRIVAVGDSITFGYGIPV